MSCMLKSPLKNYMSVEILLNSDMEPIIEAMEQETWEVLL